MVNDGNEGGSLRDDSSFVKPESSSQHQQQEQQQNYNLYRQRGTTSEGEKSLIMETEGTRLFSDLYRNTSEELFLKSLMESSIGMPVPTMEMLGFKNLSQNFRTDSEELFKSWLTNGENHGYNPTGIGHRTRQASRRISAELANLTSQHHGASMQKKKSNDVLFTQNNIIPEDISEDLNQQSMKNAVERSMHASNLYLAKAWFHSSQPMTRSRSSELRRRYAAMQNSESVLGMEAMKGDPSQGVSNLKQEFANPNDFGDVAMPMQDMSNQLGTFMSPSNSSSSTFNIPQVGNVDTVSSVVNMLKGTLERKKLGNQNDKEAVEDSSNAIYQVQDVRVSSSYDQRKGEIIHEIPGVFQEVPPGQGKDPGLLPAVHQGPIELDLEGFVNPINPVQFSMVSLEPSQSESSAAAPVMSSGFDACDGPSNSSICESSRKQAGNARGSENGSRAKESNSWNADLRERIIDNLKDDRKRGGLVRYGSITSTGSECDAFDKGDPSKKRRVERSRKMAEAKERNLTPAIPSDMQSVLKRCENLEKEVRSLKLNLSFMNRKDSEQTKQIEELQKQNEELAEEKERLLEEIERIISETGKM